MSILVKLAEYLEANDCGAQGETIFVNQMTGDTEGILLFDDTEGFMQHTNADNYYRGVLNITVRNKSTTDGEALSQKVFKLIQGQGLVLGNYKILISKPLMLPRSFGRNDGGYVEWLLAFELSFVIGDL